MIRIAPHHNSPPIFNSYQHRAGVGTIVRAGRTDDFLSFGRACHLVVLLFDYGVSGEPYGGNMRDGGDAHP